MLCTLGNMNEVAGVSEGGLCGWAQGVSLLCLFLTAPLVDHSRVILQGRDPNIPGSDYINANYVKVRFLKDGCMPKVGERTA